MRLNRLALLTLALLSTVVVTAQTLPYANSRTTINAGVLLIESQRAGVVFTAPANVAPHVWSNLDKDTGVKPASWTFDNPLGQTTMTADAFNRWSTLLGGPAGLPAVGAQLGKSDAAYWEVSLATATAGTLARFDVLSLTLNGTLSLNSIEREKLRRYVDQGGVLWVDLVNDAAITTDLANGLPYGFNWGVTVQPVEANLNHPLMRSPNPIRLEDLDQMKYSFTLGDIVTTPIDLSGNAMAPLMSWVTPDSLRLEPIVGNSDGRTVSAAQLGEGYMVVTSGGVTATLNRGFDAFSPPPRIPQVNRSFRGLSVVQDQAMISASKFAINVISLATNYSTSGAGSRSSGGSAVTVDAPMLERFRANFGPGAFEVNKSASIFKGYIITTAGSRVSVFDANPSRDIDRDGDPDDGIADPLGSGTDLIWQSSAIPGRLSAPTVIEAPATQISNPLTGLLAINQIWVVDSASNVHVFDLENPGGLGVSALAPSPIGPAGGDPPAPVGLGGPYAPTIHEGLVVVADSRSADNLGRVWLIDLNTGSKINTGSSDWGVSSFGRMSPAGGSATVGYIPIQDGSSGLDRVVYVPHQPPTIGTPRPASLTSLWLGARGEQPVRVNRTGATVRITTRASFQQLPVFFGGGTSSLGIKVTLINPNTGNPFTLSDMQTIFTGVIIDPGTRGEMIVQLSGAPGAWDFDGTMTPGDATDDVGWRLDYTIDWGQVSLVGGVRPQQYVRGTLEFPDTVANSRRIVGGATLGPDGNIFIATSEPGAADIGSTLFNLKEEGRGEFRLVYRYDLYDEMTFSLNQGAGLGDTIVVPPSFVDEDELLTDLAFLNQPISALKFVGAPVVRGDTVYCVAAGRKLVFGAPIPTSVMMAFDANPGPLEFIIAGEDTNFTLVQPDITRSTTKTAPTTFSTMRQGQFTAERIPNFGKTRIIINSAMTASNNRISDSISSSLPIMIRRSGQTDTLIEPEAIGNTAWAFGGGASGSFDPLQWYGVLNGYRCVTAPVVTGNTLFFAGSSILPDLISSGGGGPLAERGLIYAFNSQISPNDSFLLVNNVRSWQQQLTTVKKASPAPGDFTPTDNWLWPQFRGAQDFDDIRIRLMQATLPDQQAISLAVGDQALAVTGNANLYGFARSDFFVVDEGRVSRFDTSGNPLWSATQTLNAGRNRPIVNAGSSKRLSRPTRMYPDPSNSEGFWIVDSGNDRVSLVDSSGRELRTVSSFKLDPNFVPQGMGDSEATSIRDPRDVYVFESRVLAANNPFANPRPLELWRHVVVAEAGNNRIVELVDRFELDSSGRVLSVVSYVDPNIGTQQALGILLWHTPEELTGKRFSYNSIANSFVDDGFGGKRKVVSFGFGNVEPGRATIGLDTAPQDLDVSSGYGGVVIYDGPNSLVITDFAVPAVPAGAYMEETAPGSGLFDFTSAAQPADANHKIAGLTSVTLRYVNTTFGPRLSVMITEATGIYELIQPDLLNPDNWIVNWMLPTEAYKGMRRPRGATPYTTAQIGDNPQQFRPQYARRLDSGEVLLVNSYMGRTRDNTEFSGEVVLVDGTIGGAGFFPGFDVSRPNLGFNSLSVIYELPPVQGIRGIVRPVYAERQ